MLEPGVVVTVEPGIYLIDSLLAAARDERGAATSTGRRRGTQPFGGIRIEDNVVARHDAPKNMTGNAFAQVRGGARASSAG